MYKTAAVIPARYDSSRFAGKVLARETGKYLIQHIYERAICAEQIDKVIIASDSEKVRHACSEFGAECVMTSKEHKCGTDRIAEVAEGLDCEIVVNIQGDEPEIDPANIDFVAELLRNNENAVMSTLVSGFANPEEVKNPNIVKCVVDEKGRALYFSRSVIPYDREAGGAGNAGDYLRHIGIYAYRREFLLKITKLPQSKLEKIEKLEQLRVLENGYEIITAETEYGCAGIDTPEQYAEFVKRYTLTPE